MLLLLVISALLSLEDVLEKEDQNQSEKLIRSHVRTKRQANIKYLSPSDRESCKPGATVSQIRVDTSQRLFSLRNQLATNGWNLYAYIIPSEDAHQSEFPAEFDRRRQYITGFDGIHGLAIVLRDKAALWIDSSYFYQADKQVDCNWILIQKDKPNTPTYDEWIIANFGPSITTANRDVGLNPFLTTSGDWISLETKLKAANIILIPVVNDLIDNVWQIGRPPLLSKPVNALADKYAGRSWQQKVTDDVYRQMLDHKVDMLIVTQLDEIAWLFNLRGSDVQYDPFFLACAILETQSGVIKIRLYLWDRIRRLTEQPSDPETNLPLAQHLNTGNTGSCTGKLGMCVEVDDYNNFLTVVNSLNSNVKIKKIWISPKCSYGIYTVLTKEVFQRNTPIAIAKFQKNPIEQEGLRNAHKKDAVALVTYMARLEDQVKNDRIPVATEASVSNEILFYRGRQLNYRGVSYPTVSAYGQNSAHVHYSPTLETIRNISRDNLYLLSSGGQYLDGTTDVTRMFHFGEPTNYQKLIYTTVLMGQIDLSQLIFCKRANGPFGKNVAVVAKKPLWEMGLDYRHGTGHGVGSYLSANEGPGRISLVHPSEDTDEPLDRFQVFTNEPGYYEPGMFGVRLGNMMMIKQANTRFNFMDCSFLEFETLSLLPYEPHLIDHSLLSNKQIEWLNGYNEKIQRGIGPLIVNDTLASAWLLKRTQQYNILQSNKGTVPACVHVSWSFIFYVLFILLN